MIVLLKVEVVCDTGITWTAEKREAGSNWPWDSAWLCCSLTDWWPVCSLTCLSPREIWQSVVMLSKQRWNTFFYIHCTAGCWIFFYRQSFRDDPWHLLDSLSERAVWYYGWTDVFSTGGWKYQGSCHIVYIFFFFFFPKVGSKSQHVLPLEITWEVSV